MEVDLRSYGNVIQQLVVQVVVVEDLVQLVFHFLVRIVLNQPGRAY
jgi:hypothetical protein